MSGHGSLSSPSAWVRRFARLVTNGGRVLDVACGQGRNSRFLAERGYQVLAVDRDQAALDTLSSVPRVTCVAADLERDPWPFGGETFDAVIVTNYLHRPLFPHLLRSLSGDGTMLYETFARGNETYGKPSNPDFLLADAELLHAFGDALIVVAFEQGLVDADRPAVVQRLAAVGRARRWPPPLSL